MRDKLIGFGDIDVTELSRFAKDTDGFAGSGGVGSVPITITKVDGADKGDGGDDGEGEESGWTDDTEAVLGPGVRTLGLLHRPKGKMKSKGQRVAQMEEAGFLKLDIQFEISPEALQERKARAAEALAAVDAAQRATTAAATLAEGAGAGTNTKVPIVQFCFGGGVGTLESLIRSSKNKFPIIIVQGSGGVADVMKAWHAGAADKEQELAKLFPAHMSKEKCSEWLGKVRENQGTHCCTRTH